MNENSKQGTGSAKKEFFLKRWIKRLFFPQKEIRDIYTEEKMETPFRVVCKNFFSKPIPVISLIIFIIIALFVFIAPSLVTLDLGEQDSTLIDIAPGYSMMKYSKELEAVGVKKISAARNYAVGLDKNGKLHTWGYTKVSRTKDLADIPDEIKSDEIVDIAAGCDHVIAVSKSGKLCGWGDNNHHQLDFPPELISNKSGVKAIYASNQFSAAVTNDKCFYMWGNKSNADLKYNKKVYDGHVVDAALTLTNSMILTDEGEVCSPNKHPKGALTEQMPDNVKSDITAITATSDCVAALTKDGKVIVWGGGTKGEKVIPEFASPVKRIGGGRYHITALLENGSVCSWGSDRYGQTDLPEALKGKDIKDIYIGYFQNYVVDGDGNIYSWGLKGFLMGTDPIGRDVFARLVHGGKSTMTIGVVAVIIEVIIGIILGGLAGYFGGYVDILLERLAEIVGSLPFLPFCMILSAVLGSNVTPQTKMYIVMVILGILSWPGMFYLVRAQIFREREQEYVLAAKALGLKQGRIVFKHIIPNVMSVCLVSITLSFGGAMLQESSLSFLGFGVPPTTPTWGNMLDKANSSTIISEQWWNWVFVGAIFGLACICINLIGDGLRDALDPKVNGR